MTKLARRLDGSTARRLNGSTAQRLKRPADSTNHPPPRGD
ncbi:hypothetical protein BURPSS13_I0429 [Burkholderia pseudomallei S13]|nr:hypothetical protein BURPSS13_I0429 [Burkholderia pseudomallei S13]